MVVAVEPAAGHQPGMSPLFGDTTVFQDDDTIGVLNRGEPVGDGDDSAALLKLVEGLLDQFFRFGVEGGHCLVEQEDARIFQNRARD